MFRPSKLGFLIYILPAALIAHAIVFWGRGILDKEAISFVINYLARRPLLNIVYDERLNDWGAYQARELSYFFDLIDARVFSALLTRRVLFFIPLSGVVGVIAVSGIYLAGARRKLGLDRTTSTLLLSLFLSTIVVQASIAYFYRSSKIALSVVLMLFLFALTSLLGSIRPGSRQTKWGLFGLFALGLTMALCDRQGFFLFAVAAGVAGLLWLTAAVRTRTLRTGHLSIVAVCASGVALAALYNYAIDPAIIHWTNGYWPDFDYQTMPWSEAHVHPLLDQAFEMFRAQISYLFGNLTFSVVCLLLTAVAAAEAWMRRSRTGVSMAGLLLSDAVLVTLAVAGALVGMLAGMILRHPPVFGAYWYDVVPFQTLFLFGATLALSGSQVLKIRWAQVGIQALLLLMIVGNMWHYGAQRDVMAHRDRWFRTQYSRSTTWARAFEAENRQGPGGEASGWIHPDRTGATLELPVRDHNYLAGMQLAYLTWSRGTPPVDAGGPFWVPLYTFLRSPASPLNDREQIGAAIDAFRWVGVSRITLDRTRFNNSELAQATAVALTAGGRNARAWDDGRVVTVDVEPMRFDATLAPRSRVIPPTAFRATSSVGESDLPLAFDGNGETRWASGRPQSGDEWIRLEFDRLRDVASVRLLLGGTTLGDYPRELSIESVDGDQSRPLFHGSTLGPLMRGIVTDPSHPTIEIALPANHTRALIVRQVGHAETLAWSVHELTILERQP